MDGFVSGWQNYEKAKINDEEEQVKKRLKYRLAVVNFVKRNPMFLDAFPVDGAVSDPHEFAYPTPRSWEMAVEILSVLDENEPEYIEELVKGCIGDAACNLFIKYINEEYKGLEEIDIPGFVGRENEFRLLYPDRHDHVYQTMASMVFYLEQEPRKYMELWIQVVNVLHNENNTYGEYASYDGLIMRYLFNNIKLLLDTKTINSKELREFSKRISCYNLLQINALEKYQR